MTVLNLQVGQGTDDAHESVSSGAVDFTFALLYFGSVASNRHVGIRFTGVSGLSGASIDAATLTFRGADADSGAFVGDWYAHDVAAPGTFTSTTSNISDTAQRPRTAATCEGDGSDFGTWADDVDQTFTGDGANTIADIIQELADSYDPSAIVLLHIYTSGTGERIAFSYELNTAKAVKLDITFTTGGPSIVTGQVDLAGVGSLASIAGVVISASAALSGVGALVAAGTIGVIHEGAAVLSGVGTLILGTPVRTLVGQSSILGEGSLAAVGERGALAAAVLDGVGTLTVIGEVGIEGRAALAGVGTLTVVGQRIVSGAVALSGVGSLDVVGSPTLVGAATLSGVGTMTILADSGVFVFTVFGEIRRLIDPADYPVGVALILEVQFSSPVGSETKARLFNITDATSVSGSGLSTTSLTTVRLRTSALSLAVGAKEYRIEFAGQPGDVYNVVSADIIPVSS